MHLKLPLTSTTHKFNENYNIRHLAGPIDALSARPQLGSLVKVLYLQLTDPKDFDYDDQIEILNLVPHLQELYLSPPSLHLDFTGMLFLKHLRLDLDDRVDCYNPVQLIAHHFWIPTLRILEIEGLELDGQWLDQSPLQRDQKSPIIDLRIYALTYTDQSVGILPSLLSCVKSLKRFTLDADLDAAIAHMVQDWLSLDAILYALRLHTNTLKEILIAASDGGTLRRTVPTCSIMNFSSLKKLAIPISCLEYCKGSNCDLALPPKLEELQLQQQECYEESSDWYFCYEALKALAERKRDCFPELKFVVWWTQMSIAWLESSRRPPLPPIGNLICIFEDVDVLFSWIKHSDFRGSPFGKAFMRPPAVEGLEYEDAVSDDEHDYEDTEFDDHDGDDDGDDGGEDEAKHIPTYSPA
ncbi:unnamed protein product [Penicillium pancosmium]